MTTESGKTYSSKVFAGEREEVNRFTGFGLVNADAAVRSVQERHGGDGED